MSFLKSSSAFLLGVFTAITVFIVVTVVFKHSASSRVNTITIPMENFDGSQWSTPNTMAASTLASCKYGQFQSHTVRTETGETASNWLWTNDRDQVNILAQLGNSNRFMITLERRYGLWSESYSALNGYVRFGENASSSALRVLEEEHGLHATLLQPTGKYRVQVNRGGGFLYTFIARNCTAYPKNISSLKRLRLGNSKQIIIEKDDLISLLLEKNRVQEAQWAASLALGVLSL